MIYKPFLFIKKNNKIVLILLTIFFAFFSSRDIPVNLDFENSIFSLFSGMIYPTCLFYLLVICSGIIINEIDKNYNILLRYNNKKKYIESVLRIIFSNNLFLCIIFNLLVVLFIAIERHNSISFSISPIYNIPLAINNIIMFSKFFIIYEIIIKFAFLIYKYYSKISSIIYIFVLVIVKNNWNYDFSPIQSFENMHLFLGYYLFPIKYSNVFFDLFAFLLMITILTLILEGFNYFLIRKRKTFFEV